MPHPEHTRDKTHIPSCTLTPALQPIKRIGVFSESSSLLVRSVYTYKLSRSLHMHLKNNGYTAGYRNWNWGRGDYWCNGSKHLKTTAMD